MQRGLKYAPLQKFVLSLLFINLTTCVNHRVNRENKRHLYSRSTLNLFYGYQIVKHTNHSQFSRSEQRTHNPKVVGSCPSGPTCRADCPIPDNSPETKKDCLARQSFFHASTGRSGERPTGKKRRRFRRELNSRSSLPRPPDPDRTAGRLLFHTTPGGKSSHGRRTSTLPSRGMDHPFLEASSRRISVRRILPLMVLGSASTNSITRGYL